MLLGKVGLAFSWHTQRDQTLVLPLSPSSSEDTLDTEARITLAMMAKWIAMVRTSWMMVATGRDPKAGSVPKRASSHGRSRPSALAIVLAAYGIPTVPTRVAQSAEEVEKIARALLESSSVPSRGAEKSSPSTSLPAERTRTSSQPTDRAQWALEDGTPPVASCRSR